MVLITSFIQPLRRLPRRSGIDFAGRNLFAWNQQVPMPNGEEPENSLYRAFQAAMQTIYRGDDLALVVPAILGVQAAGFS